RISVWLYLPHLPNDAFVQLNFFRGRVAKRPVQPTSQRSVVIELITVIKDALHQNVSACNPTAKGFDPLRDGFIQRLVNKVETLLLSLDVVDHVIEVRSTMNSLDYLLSPADMVQGLEALPNSAELLDSHFLNWLGLFAEPG